MSVCVFLNYRVLLLQSDLQSASGSLKRIIPKAQFRLNPTWLNDNINAAGSGLLLYRFTRVGLNKSEDHKHADTCACTVSGA